MKVFGVVAALVVLLFVVLVVTGGHRPRGHGLEAPPRSPATPTTQPQVMGHPA